MTTPSGLRISDRRLDHGYLQRCVTRGSWSASTGRYEPARAHRSPIWLDEIAVALDEQCVVDPQVYEVLLDCHELGWQLSTLPNLYERLAARLPVEYAARDLETLPAYNETAGYRLYRAAKRLIDIMLALVGLLPLGLLIPFVALGNGLWSPGPCSIANSGWAEAAGPLQ